MTGYGLCRAQTNDVTLEISIRAVNGRFLETRFHLPKQYYVFESDLKKKLTEYALRGTVDVYISRKVKPAAHAGKIVINTKLAQEYLKSFKKLAKDLKMNDAVRFDLISRQPDVIQMEEEDHLNPQEVALLKKGFEAALKKFDIEKTVKA